MSPRRWSGKTQLHAGAVLGVLSMVLVLGLGVWAWEANDRQTTRLAVVELSGKNLSTMLDGQIAQFQACKDASAGTPGCNTAVSPPAAQVAPAIVTGPKGDQGYPGLQGPGPSAAQVAGAVAVYLAAHPAPAGKDGKTPDPAVVAAQIYTAVANYLSTNPPADGKDGNDGLNATDDQIAAAVADYCAAHDGCRGPAGPDGSTGATGPTAPAPTAEPTPTDTSPGNKP